jgi:Ca2+-binding EF-hand superfamily protein
MMFLLTELELVGKDELRNINRMFDSLDSDGSGVLTVQDIQSELKAAQSRGQCGARQQA